MTHKDFTICVDMDDTIENLLEAWVPEVSRRYNLDVSVADVTDWDLSKIFPSLTHEQIFKPLEEEEFWKTVTPKLDAIDFLHRLVDEGFEVYICTNSNYRTVKSKFENLLFKYFPFITDKHLIICSKKQMINCDVLVDDYIKNLTNANYTGLFIRAQHNKLTQIPNSTNNIISVTNWEEIYEIIHKLYRGRLANEKQN